MNSIFAFYDHQPRYHHGLSRKEHIEQETGSWFEAYYGQCYNRMQCYGSPCGSKWSIKDRIDGPRSRNYKRLLNRNMRKRARREGKRLLEQETQHD